MTQYECTLCVKIINKSHEEVLQAYLYILNNTYEVTPYLSTHKAITKDENSRQKKKFV